MTGQGLRQPGPDRGDVGREPLQLLEVGGGEGGQAPGARRCQAHVHDPVIVAVWLAADEPGPLGPVDELDHGVVAQEEVVGQITDRRTAVVAAHGEQELVLGRGQPGRLRLLLAPAEEAAQTVTEAEETPVLGVVEVHTHIVPR